MTTTITTNTITIRKFTKGDYEAIVGIYNTVFAAFGMTVEAFRFDDEKRPDRVRHERWVAERDGRIVAYGQYDQHPWIFDPHKFEVEIVIDPACVSQGIGTKLFGTLVKALRPLAPTSVTMWTREDMSCRVEFLTSRGFAERFRMWALTLDLRTFDPTPFARYARDVAEQGVQIVSRAKLGNTEDTRRKIFDMSQEVREDLPLPVGEVRTPTTYDEWLEREDSPTRIDDGYFIAVADGQFIGVSNLCQSPAPGTIRTGLTAVRRAYRGRGIAFALKLRAVEFAMGSGYVRVVTDNASVNRPMLSINERLGFVKEPAWVEYAAQWKAILGSVT